jgi:membrane-bound lytic murein transglycosylase D
MSLAQMLSAYITLNVLIIAACVSLLTYSASTGLAKRRIGAAALLKLHYAVFSVLIFIMVLQPFLPAREIFKPAIKVWSAHSIKTFSSDYTKKGRGGYLSLPFFAGDDLPDADRVKLICIIMGGAILLLGVVRISRDLYRLLIIRRNSYLIKGYGTISIFANDQIKVPFSYWLPGQANIIVPTNLLGKKPDYKITLFHEFEHHRNGDTKWVYAIWLLRLVCVINPFIHLWTRLLSELQEFACDETLVDRRKIDSQVYARCLLETAESALGQRQVPVCATGLTFMVERKLLKRRIEKMSKVLPLQFKWQVNFMAVIFITMLMVSITFASNSVVQDRRITEAQALKMAEKAKIDTTFPVVVNDLVLRQLNSYLGTPEGREFIKNALKRMENYREVIEAKLGQYGVPEEFMAIPVIESGYQNLEQPSNKQWGAGIWMFIESTARNYGLRVDESTDQRLDVELLTDAAMRYLSANRLRFNDWELSILAYNMGESKVQEAIDKTGSRDVWDLIQAGYENDKDYYPKLMAAIIILKNPDVVN